MSKVRLILEWFSPVFTIYIVLPNRPGSWRSCRHGDRNGQSITDHAVRPYYLTCTSNTPTHASTLSPNT